MISSTPFEFIKNKFLVKCTYQKMTMAMSHVGEVLARHTMSYIGDLIFQVTHLGDRYECKHL